MNCQNCGIFNQAGSKFCIGCGQNLVNSSVNNTYGTQNLNNNVITSTPIQNNQANLNVPVSETNYNNQAFANGVQPINSYNGSMNQSIPNTATNISFIGYFLMIITIILKPFTALKEEINKFDSFKNPVILSLIISGISTILSLFSSMLSAVRVREYSLLTFSYVTTWKFGNLKELKYVQIIGKNFLIYLAIIFVIAGIYYLAGLILKKQNSFSRLLGISALAITPLLICSLILSPVLSIIWVGFVMPVILIGAVYTTIIIYEGFNNEILLEGNIKYYFNLICFSILGIIAYLLCTKVFTSSIIGGYLMNLY